MVRLVVSVTIGNEFYVEQTLLDAQLQAYCPKYRARVRNRFSVSGGLKFVSSTRPLFPGYLFVAKEDAGKEVRPDVASRMRFVRFGDKFAELPDHQFDLVKKLETEMEEQSWKGEQPSKLVPKVGDKVRVSSGALEGKSGVVRSVQGKFISVEVQGWPVHFKLPVSLVEVA